MTFDAEKFTTAFYNADTDLTTDSFIDLEYTSLLVQAAYDQGRADAEPELRELLKDIKIVHKDDGMFLVIHSGDLHGMIPFRGNKKKGPIVQGAINGWSDRRFALLCEKEQQLDGRKGDA